MDTTRIVDFAVDPVDRILWGTLDRPPALAWIDALELAVAGNVRGATVTIEQKRASLRRRFLDLDDRHDRGPKMRPPGSARSTASKSASPAPTRNSNRWDECQCRHPQRSTEAENHHSKFHDARDNLCRNSTPANWRRRPRSPD
jgi:hypothetical protein